MKLLERARSIAPIVDPNAPVIVLPQSQAQTVDWSEYVAPNTGRYNKNKPVTGSPDLNRVIALPRRAPVDLRSDTAKALVEMMTERLTRYNPRCECAKLNRPCIRELLPAQAWALYEAPLAGGLVAPVGVGHGKTGLDILLPIVMQSNLSMLLIPPGLIDQIRRDYIAWSQHFKVPSIRIGDVFGRIVPGDKIPSLQVIPYSMLSRPESTALIESLKPDLVLADEVQKLRHRDTATTRRVMRYFADHRTTRLCGYSGTITADTIKDYAHLCALALRELSPLPLHPNVVEEWATAIDPPTTGNTFPAPAGALARIEPDTRISTQDDLHQVFQRRFKQTKGIVATTTGAINASIYIYEKEAPPIPEDIRKALRVLRDTSSRPDGEEFFDMMQVARCARELASGFYYFWRYPRGEPEDLILKWFDVRKCWHKELRERLKRPKEHLDSEQLCKHAAQRYIDGYEGDLPVWDSEFYAPWKAIKDLVVPTPDVHWIDDYLARDAAEWAVKNRGVVWYEHDAFGRRVAELAGLPCHGGGPDAGRLIAEERGDRSIVASIKAHGTGRDGLQLLYTQCLFASPPPSGDLWEQVIGRLHRIGQRSHEVTNFVYRHTQEFRDSIDKAVVKSRYIQGTIGSEQKLLQASIGFSID